MKRPNEKGEAIAIIVSILFVGALLFVFLTTPYEREIKVKGVPPVRCLIYPEDYAPGELMSSHWFDEAVQIRTKVLLDAQFPEIKKTKMFGMWHIRIKGKLKKCACSPNGKYLYIGCKVDYPPIEIKGGVEWGV